MQVPPPAPGLVFDDDLGDANARRIRELAVAGRAPEAERWIEGIRHWDARTFYIDAVSRWEGRPGWLDTWVRASPSPIAKLVGADHLIHWAWGSRGQGWAPSAGSQELVEQRLAAADEQLGQAALADVADPTACCLMLRVARGRGLGLAEKQERFQELRRRDPHHRRGHTEMLRALSEKWGGSHDLMFQFAWEAGGRSGPGSSLHTLVAEAHVERWLMADRGGADTDYWQRPEVAAEIHRAATAAFDPAAYRSTPMSVVDRSYFAFCFTQMGALNELRQQITAMSIPYRWPWAMFGDPAQLLIAARRLAGLTA